MYDGFQAETTTIVGHNGDVIAAYLAKPLGAGPFPAVNVLHHMPGWDEPSKLICAKLALNGYIAVMPNLHHRVGPGTPDDQAAAVRAEGGNPDEQILGDLHGSMHVISLMTTWNGKQAVMGFCSGGRQTYLAAGRVPELDAAVDCWGGRVIAAADTLTERQPVAPIEYTKNINCPLMGIFGNDDAEPDPEQVNKTEATLKEYGKTYEFHRYDGAGHGFFAVDRPGYRPVQATDAWGKIFAFYEKYLKAS
jgi:carboxymethylenebutenolidase